MRLSTLAACVHLKQHGFEPILQVTCRDRNRLALQSDLLGRGVLRHRERLALTGDHVVVGDHPQAKAVFDLESVQLLETDRAAQGRSRTCRATSSTESPNFFVGAVVTPDANPLAPQLAKFDKKVRAGAKYFQTQAVYDPDSFKRIHGVRTHAST